jgi:hypothetical protein
MAISELDALSDEDRTAVTAAANVVQQLSAVLRQVQCDVTRPIRVGIAPEWVIFP